MSRNGSGGYSPPNNSWNPATNGSNATAADWTAMLADLSNALTQSVSADGQTPITGDIQMGGNKLTGLNPGANSGDSVNYAQLQGAQSQIAGSTSNFGISIPTAATTATVTADEVILETALNGSAVRLINFNKNINLATTGIGGMDVGSAPANGYVALYAIYNPTTLTSALLAVNANAAAAPSIYGGANMPAGYTASALLSVWPINVSSQFIVGFQVDRKLSFALVSALNTSTVVGVPASYSLGSIIPKNAKNISGLTVLTGSTAGVGYQLSIGPSATISSIYQQAFTVQSGPTSIQTAFPEMQLLTPQTVYYTTGGAGGNYQFFISGYSI